MPFHLPSHDALVFGDAVAESVAGFVWAPNKVDAKVERFYRDRFNPTLEPLLELDGEKASSPTGCRSRGGKVAS